MGWLRKKDPREGKADDETYREENNQFAEVEHIASETQSNTGHQEEDGECGGKTDSGDVEQIVNEARLSRRRQPAVVVGGILHLSEFQAFAVFPAGFILGVAYPVGLFLSAGLVLVFASYVLRRNLSAIIRFSNNSIGRWLIECLARLWNGSIALSLALALWVVLENRLDPVVAMFLWAALLVQLSIIALRMAVLVFPEELEAGR